MLQKKKLICSIALSFLVLSFTANARTYYVSNSGNDSNSGTDASSPWQTINKVNSFKNFAPGDNILFRRGDTFYGGITVSNSGSSGNPITYGAYGSGVKPVITGFTNVTSWNSLGGNIWESNDAVSSLPYTNMVAVNGVNKAMGRYPNSTGPNTGYLYIKSHSGNGSITGDGLGSNNWSGAGIVIRKERWALERGTINSQSGSTLYYTDPGVDYPQDGFGFFIQNDTKTLDVNGEWYYNPSNHKLRIYSTSSPADVKIATVENLVSMDRKSYIVFDNLAFSGSNSDALYCANYGSDLTVQNCDISFAGMSAIWCIMANSLIQNNSIKDANYLGIHTTEPNANIRSNSLSNINILEGMDQELTSAGAIATVGSNTTIQYNQITNCGYSGIRFGGPNTKIINNFINRFCLIKEDGGGIDMSSRDRARGSLIDANIVLNGIGSKYGTSDTTLSDFGGIFVDAFGTEITITNNTVANTVAAGIKLHGANNIVVKNNTTYNNGSNSWTKGGLELMSDDAFPIRDITSQGNILVARTSQQYAFFYRPEADVQNVIQSFGTAANNYYVKPIDQSTAILINHTYYNIANWQSFFSGDGGSYGSPKNISDLNDLRFEYNASSSAKTIQLDANYIDVKNASYNGSVTLAPYTSVVLIRNGSLTTPNKDNISPVANVGDDRVIDLPKNSIILPGSGTDEDGSVVLFLWSQISGPSTATLTNSNSSQAGASDLVAGTYQFQLKVTDDGGATATAILKITVQSENSVPNIAPVASVGEDRVIDLPKNSIVLPGSGTDEDGSIVSYSWNQISGPSTASLINSNSAQAGAADLVAGSYQFQLEVTDDKGSTATAALKVTVQSENSVTNIAPVASVGEDRTIDLPKNSIVLPGSGTDEDGSVVSYSWSQISGPSIASLMNPNSAQAGAGDLVAGSYQFQLEVTDDKGATATASLRVTVQSLSLSVPNISPVAHVGLDRIIELPKNSIVLPGSGTDVDGSVVSYSWSQISGPSTATLVNPNSAQSGAGGLLIGTYQFQLRVTDDKGANGSAILKVTVTYNPESPLLANAGPDRVIELPKNSIVLPGSGTDANGTIVSYLWTKKSGPSEGAIIKPSAAQSGATGLVEGIYVFELQVTNDQGETNTDDFQVTVTQPEGGITQMRRMDTSAAVSSTTAINDFSNESQPTELKVSITAYPNPFTNVITVNITGEAGPYSLSLTDVLGRTLLTRKGDKNAGTYQESINTSNIESGIYFLTVIQNNNASTIKMQK
jgi:hypothetical protein